MDTLDLDFNRAAYMSGKVDHQTYYVQYVTDEVLSLVKYSIGEDAIKFSTDPYFNDIPLYRWDVAGTRMPLNVVLALNASNASTTRGGVAGHSKSDLVCILKAAARTIRGH